MASNRIEVHIDGNDKLSPVLNKIQGNISGLGMATNGPYHWRLCSLRAHVLRHSLKRSR